MATILVVDDSPVIRRMLSYTLKKNGYTSVEAKHGKDALDQLSRKKVELVITDVTMPKMDGLTLLSKLRADSRYQKLPIVMLTASGQERDRQAAKEKGANGFLTKPTSSVELIKTVTELLS